MEKYPKVLLIDCFFNKKLGGGITLTNLFTGWPKDKIYVAATRIFNEGISICKNYYRFGFKETKRPWPLYKFQPFYQSKEVVFEEDIIATKDDHTYSFQKTKYNPLLKKTIEKILHFLGVYHILFPFNVSNDFLAWVRRVNPDVIYVQLSSVQTILFVNDFLKQVNKPYVIHIMDDWPSTINRIGIENIYLRWKIRSIYRKLFAKATGLMSIGQGMSDVYRQRYGLNFMPFQNCIEPGFWSQYRKTDWSVNGSFKILYAGRVSIGISHSVLKIAKAVEKLGENGLSIEFQIQSSSIPSRFMKKFKQLKHTKINDFLPYDELPKKFASVDLLVLPMDFRGKGLKYIRLSMPTKVPEYFASGTPILVFADKTTAVVKYAQNDGWGEVVTENSVKALAKAIEDISKDAEKRKLLSQRALLLMKKNHSNDIVREKFREKLMSCLS